MRFKRQNEFVFSDLEGQRLLVKLDHSKYNLQEMQKYHAAQGQYPHADDSYPYNGYIYDVRGNVVEDDGFNSMPSDSIIARWLQDAEIRYRAKRNYTPISNVMITGPNNFIKTYGYNELKDMVGPNNMYHADTHDSIKFYAKARPDVEQAFLPAIMRAKR